MALKWQHVTPQLHLAFVSNSAIFFVPRLKVTVLRCQHVMRPVVMSNLICRWTLRARRATKLNLSVWSYYSVKYWWVGAALMPKLRFCGWIWAGFGMCAARVGPTVGLDMPKLGQFRCLVARIEVTVARILNAEARILLVDAPFLVTVARILVTEANFKVTGARILNAEAKILLTEAPFLK